MQDIVQWATNSGQTAAEQQKTGGGNIGTSIVTNQCGGSKYTLNLDPDPEYWPNLDPDPGLCYQFKKNNN